MGNSALLQSSLAKKYWMSATGLFLCLFLVGHLLGNLQLLITPENGARDTFNLYAQFMTTNPAIYILSLVTYISIIFHAIDGVVLTRRNMKARPIGYVRNNPSANSTWSSRNMGVLGTIILVFIVLHMKQFWAVMHWGPIPEVTTESGVVVKDLYTTTVKTFQDPQYGMIWVGAYFISMLAVGFHLYHGFQSGFQSLGLNHPRYSPIIRKFGYGFAIIVPALFAIIPIYIAFVLEKI